MESCLQALIASPFHPYANGATATFGSLLPVIYEYPLLAHTGRFPSFGECPLPLQSGHRTRTAEGPLWATSGLPRETGYRDVDQKIRGSKPAIRD